MTSAGSFFGAFSLKALPLSVAGQSTPSSAFNTWLYALFYTTIVLMSIQNRKTLPVLDPVKLSGEKNTMLFETGYVDRANNKTYLFSKPLAVIRAYDYTGLKKAFQKIENYSKKYYIAGYLSYEAGYYFENDIFTPKKRSNFPLLEMLVFNKAACFEHFTGKSRNLSPYYAKKTGKKSRPYKVKKLRMVLDFEHYKRHILKIKEHIKAGDTYQVNFTGKLKFGFTGNSYNFYKELKNNQRVSFGAYINLGRRKILSLSPELFFCLKNNFITAKPMKGTVKRGKNLLEDRKMIAELKTGLKSRAENIMIVDMIRNDLGKICRTGSVKTSGIFEVEKYNTLFQMITTVTGELLPGTTYYDIFKSIFPGGSVTGAPKIRTMEIIRELEAEARGVYCGALGIIFPGEKEKQAVFNIPIRTVFLENKRGELGAGGGIVWDSAAKSEYQEALLKSNFLTENTAGFCLLETLLWEDGYFLLPGHIKRLKASAAYFSYPLETGRIKEQLKRKEKEFNKGCRYKLRLLISENGTFNLEASRLEQEQVKDRIVVSGMRTNSRDRFLYHKTTNRFLYEAERKKIVSNSILDIIFLNEKNEITEGAISNVFILKNGRYYTPPVSAGLLPGVYRSYYINRTKAVERPLSLLDLKKADSIIVTNSVIKARTVRLV